jgi:hypothetical protein
MHDLERKSIFDTLDENDAADDGILALVQSFLTTRPICRKEEEG